MPENRGKRSRRVEIFVKNPPPWLDFHEKWFRTRRFVPRRPSSPATGPGSNFPRFLRDGASMPGRSTQIVPGKLDHFPPTQRRVRAKVTFLVRREEKRGNFPPIFPARQTTFFKHRLRIQISHHSGSFFMCVCV